VLQEGWFWEVWGCCEKTKFSPFSFSFLFPFAGAYSYLPLLCVSIVQIEVFVVFFESEAWILLQQKSLTQVLYSTMVLSFTIHVSGISTWGCSYFLPRAVPSPSELYSLMEIKGK
jgi:hypothetical protein